MKEIITKVSKNGIVAGLISSAFFLYFLQPILDFTGSIIVTAYRHFSTSLYDRIFSEAAMGKPDYTFMLIQSVAFGLLFAAFYITITSLFRKKEISQLTPPLSTPINTLPSQSPQSKNKVYKSRFKFLIKIAFLIFILTGFISLVLSNIKLTTIETFEQEIKIITPYIDSKVKETIISDFARMQSHSDYEKIQVTISKIAKDNHIVLPEFKLHIF